MNRAQIEIVRDLAAEVVVLSVAALKRLDVEVESFNEWNDRHDAPQRKPSPRDHSYGSKETAALRRRSLDLTRALSEMRRPG